MSSMVNTAQVQDHRKLRFNSIDDMLAQVDRIVAADKVGTLRRSGNWTTGQVLGHLATWIDFGYEGFPMRVPWFIKLILRGLKKKYIRNGMPMGVRIPKTENGTFGTEVLSTDEGARRLRAALKRLKTEPAIHHSPAWGKMT